MSDQFWDEQVQVLVPVVIAELALFEMQVEREPTTHSDLYGCIQKHVVYNGFINLQGIYAMSSRQLIVTLPTTDNDTGICRETLEKLCQLVGKDKEGVINQALALYARVMFPAYDPNDSGSFSEEQLSMIQKAAGPASMKVTKSIFKP